MSPQKVHRKEQKHLYTLPHPYKANPTLQRVTTKTTRHPWVPKRYTVKNKSTSTPSPTPTRQILPFKEWQPKRQGTQKEKSKNTRHPQPTPPPKEQKHKAPFTPPPKEQKHKAPSTPPPKKHKAPFTPPPKEQKHKAPSTPPHPLESKTQGTLHLPLAHSSPP